MSIDRKPKKPVRNPIEIVFPKSGPVRKVEEELPRKQESLELTIGKKFLGALKQFMGIEYTYLRSGSEPADIMCQDLNGQIVEIQIVEVVDKQLIRLQQMRSSYKEELIKVLGNEILLFNGCRVTLFFLGEPQYLPQVKSKEGQACISIIADFVRNVAKKAITIDVGKIFFRDTKNLPADGEVSVLVQRILPVGEPVHFEFNWNGAGPSYRVGVSRNLLTQAVESKVEKHYSKPSNGKFILLAYSIDTRPIEKQDPDVVKSRQLLSTSKHPFDAAWYIYPYAHRNTGSIIHIWDRNEIDNEQSKISK